MSVRKAVIVAAGRSSRLYPLTENLPKGLLDVAGEGLLERSLRILRENGIEEIAVVIGFCREKMVKALSYHGVEFIFNPFFAETNNMGSLFFARAFVGDDPFIYLHSDILYEPSLLAEMIALPAPGEINLLVDEGPTDDEAMKVRVEDGRFVESSKQVPIAEAFGEWVGIATVSSEAVTPLFEEIALLLDGREFEVYDTAAFNRMAAASTRFAIVKTTGRPWVEIDFPEDLERARELFD
jgi:choline kinase